MTTKERVRTLQYDLHLLLNRHSLPEVLDRLQQLISEESRLARDTDPEIHQAWTNLEIQLEQATTQALTIVTLTDDDNPWRR